MKIELRANVLRLEKLSEDQVKQLIQRVTQDMNLNVEDIIYRKVINKIRINQFTLKHRSLKVMKIRTNHSSYQNALLIVLSETCDNDFR